MSVYLTPDRKTELKTLCQAVVHKNKIRIRQLAALIGKMVASEQYAPL
jgi:hypothetical protein